MKMWVTTRFKVPAMQVKVTSGLLEISTYGCGRLQTVVRSGAVRWRKVAVECAWISAGDGVLACVTGSTSAAFTDSLTRSAQVLCCCACKCSVLTKRSAPVENADLNSYREPLPKVNV
jgi:hypothetical protein